MATAQVVTTDYLIIYLKGEGEKIQLWDCWFYYSSVNAESGQQSLLVEAIDKTWKAEYLASEVAGMIYHTPAKE